MKKSGIAFITGCSSGIGKELTRQLLQHDWTVYAGVRRVASLADVNDPGLHPVALEVNQPDQIAAAMELIKSQHGRLDLLVNNAGYGAMGPLVEMPLKEIRTQFETNTFAPLALIQAAFPLLRNSRQARIINIGSVSGILVTPFSGAYCATKAALHILSDALRMELAPFGIKVITVQPGAIESDFANTAEAGLAATLPQDSLYTPIREFIEKRARASKQNPTPTVRFVGEVVKVIHHPHPPATVRIGYGGTSLPLLKRWLPGKWLDLILSRTFGLNRLTRIYQKPAE